MDEAEILVSEKTFLDLVMRTVPSSGATCRHPGAATAPLDSDPTRLGSTPYLRGCPFINARNRVSPLRDKAVVERLRQAVAQATPCTQ